MANKPLYGTIELQEAYPVPFDKTVLLAGTRITGYYDGECITFYEGSWHHANSLPVKCYTYYLACTKHRFILSENSSR